MNWEYKMATMKKAAPSKKAAYAMFEKTEPAKIKKAEIKNPESKKEKARETKVGMNMMKKMGKKK
jgi:hypothetical protein